VAQEIVLGGERKGEEGGDTHPLWKIVMVLGLIERKIERGGINPKEKAR
jgi:hypothetical protein